MCMLSLRHGCFIPIYARLPALFFHLRACMPHAIHVTAWTFTAWLALHPCLVLMYVSAAFLSVWSTAIKIGPLPVGCAHHAGLPLWWDACTAADAYGWQRKHLGKRHLLPTQLAGVAMAAAAAAAAAAAHAACTPCQA